MRHRAELANQINEAMLLSGMAIVYLPKPGVSNMFRDAERQAKSGQRGMWSGEFVTPAEFRKAKRQQEQPS